MENVPRDDGDAAVQSTPLVDGSQKPTSPEWIGGTRANALKSPASRHPRTKRSSDSPHADSRPPSRTERGVTQRPSSPQRVAANRRNAMRSSGPRSPEGRAAVARNAIKHGLLASSVVSPSLEGSEGRAAFDEQHQRLRKVLKPVGELEDMLVSDMAINWYQLGRARRFESAVIEQRITMITTATTLEHALGLDMHRQGIGTPVPRT